MNDHDWAHIDDGPENDGPDNLPAYLNGQDLTEDLDEIVPDFWAACSDDTFETDHDYVRDFPAAWAERLINSGTLRAWSVPAGDRPKIIQDEIVEADVVEDDQPDPADPVESGTEITKREPTKRVVIVYGRWELPIKGTSRRGYTYETDLPLAVGDIVIVPPTAIRSTEQEATVVRLGSDYSGWVAKIERMAESLEDHAWYCTCRSCNEGGEGVEIQ